MSSLSGVPLMLDAIIVKLEPNCVALPAALTLYTCKVLLELVQLIRMRSMLLASRKFRRMALLPPRLNT
jgi:hypothetical protein